MPPSAAACAAFDAAPQGHGQLAALQMLDMIDVRPAAANQPAITSSSKPRRMCASVARSSSRSCAAKSTTSKRPAGRKHARRLGDRGRRRMGIMQHLVDDHAVGRLIGERKRVHVALAQARLDPRRLELDAGQTKHLRRAVDARSPGSRAGRTARSSARCRCRCPPAGRAAACPGTVDRPLDLAFGDMERADLVPHLGMAGEIAVGRLGALGADRFGARGVGCEQRLRSRASAQSSISANIGSTRSASASVRNTQLPSLRRSSTPASARIFRWRDTRGWLWPSTCASSPTDSSISRRSATMRSRVGSASAWKRSASGRVGGHEIRI